ncbi:uncharacterized protein LOC131294098 [Anopheles ziemanni]|uniref:uncharacterized protein LOC131264832 n=1 Tax=Anopheles coustani TaxID=139045 RepID=UPI002659EEDD|nr:uncharacterized protein LOC131264832 [Anopheles coustani]XP_058178128.1 uncharacterized protein LOC131294098 [Anopheles ziemanni]
MSWCKTEGLSSNLNNILIDRIKRRSFKRPQNLNPLRFNSLSLQMGNVLCKEPNTNASHSTGNTFSNLSSVICPNGLGKGKTHPMRKTYFTRSAVDASKKTTSATGWQSVGLHVPSASPKVIDTPPVAPPRKKRGATLDGRYRSDDSLQVKNGFQDVFGRESRRHSCHDITRPASVPPPRPEVPALPARQTSCFEIDASNDAFSDFSKVPTTAELEKSPAAMSQIPRVGNRKSDKFFGERLADSLSSPASSETVVKVGETKGDEKPMRGKKVEPTVDDVDKIEKFVETVQDSTPVVVERRKQASESRKAVLPEPSKEASSLGPQEAPKEGSPTNDVEEDLMKYIDRTVSADNQIGRRAEFLMAMLEDYNDSVRYDGMQPVEEPLIVPKRRKSRHICDDHDHLHAKLHEHEKEASGGAPAPNNLNVIRTEASIELAPRKPSRDFSKYKPIEPEPDGLFDSEDEPPIAPPIRMKQKASPGKQREELPAPPAPPKFQKSRSESQFDRQLSTSDATSTASPLKPPPVDGEDSPPKAHTPRMLKRIISMPATEHLGKEPSARPDTPQRPPLTKSSSSGSFAAVDLHRTRISVERFTPEDYAHHTGVDELVKPKSKLTTRKISWKSTEPPSCRTPTPTQERPTNPSFTIGGSEVVTTVDGNTLCPPEPPRRKRSDTSTEMGSIGEREREVEPTEEGTATRKMSQAKLYQQLHSKPEDNSLRKFCLGSFIESSNVLQHHDVVNVLDRVYTASDNKENIVEQFQAYLEDQLNAELDEPNPANPNIAKLLEKLSRADNTPASNGKEIEDETLENVKIELVGSSLSDGSTSSQGKSSDVDDCFDPEFEKIEKSEIVGELPKIDNHNPKHAGYAGRRRDSIEYMSDWFGGDSDGSNSMLSVAGEDRGSSGRIHEAVSRKGPPAHPHPPRHPPNGGRRESIEDVGQWFSNHNILRPSFGEEFEEPSRRLRRGSDSFLGYDQHRQYPFGQARNRSESQSAEMFEDITKLQEQHKDTATDGVPPVAGCIVISPQQAKRKVLEHRNSSDALLMKVLNKPHLVLVNSTSKHSSAEKLNTKPEENAVKPSETTTTSDEENKPLLKPDEPSASTVQDSKLAANNEKVSLSSDTTKGDQRQEQHNEHSTLLKFLSKENLIE